jgi:hypothetical protein
MMEAVQGCHPQCAELSDDDLERVAAGQSNYVMPDPDDP